ncbi:cyanoexosortase A [cf. Phormidesmis sp. LEGE 11477]|uniref:cyanoexosortase A n=1 Tax=cf. Phormidesmis sp. LEGE 11477 TaxID=1828680 RepID=UPI001881B201|nr:cyanoexosortase A [cf. Phormidesmis sp. LEGE 11477]MBE9062336.1 cyanoexosortase A [cf. Phormidesmis sp. LEGE 11477]
MERFVLAPAQSGKFFYLYLVGTVAGLAVVYLTLVDRIGNESLFGNGCLFWGACISLLWQKRHEFLFGSDLISSTTGLLIVTVVLVRTVSLPTESVLLAFPFLSLLGITLIASGWRGLRQFRSPLLILFFLGLPQLLIGTFLDISIVTAKVSAFLLWYVGFDAVLKGVFIHLPGGSIEVYRGCSGLANMLYMLGISAIFSVFLPLNRSKQLLSVFVSVCLGFFVNAVRVALLTILVANSTEEAFEYWHLGEGSLIFSMLTVMLFGCFYILLIKWQTPKGVKEPQRIDL